MGWFTAIKEYFTGAPEPVVPVVYTRPEGAKPPAPKNYTVQMGKNDRFIAVDADGKEQPLREVMPQNAEDALYKAWQKGNASFTATDLYGAPVIVCNFQGNPNAPVLEGGDRASPDGKGGVSYANDHKSTTAGYHQDVGIINNATGKPFEGPVAEIALKAALEAERGKATTTQVLNAKGEVILDVAIPQYVCTAAKARSQELRAASGIEHWEGPGIASNQPSKDPQPKGAGRPR